MREGGKKKKVRKRYIRTKKKSHVVKLRKV